MNKRIVIAVTICLSFFPSVAICANAAKILAPLALADWSVNATHNLASDPPSLEAVKDFENRFWGASEEDAREFGDDVCEFRFADLRSSGNLSLIMMIGSKNSRFGCTRLYIFDRVPTGFELYQSKAADAAIGHDLAHSVLDINHDGRHELVLWADLAPFATGTAIGQLGCNAIWPLIFAWTGNAYSDVSDRYKDYYTGYLKTVKTRLAEYSSVLAPAPPPKLNPAPEMGNAAEQTDSEPHLVAPGEVNGGVGGIGARLFAPVPTPEGAMPAWASKNEADRNYPCAKIELAKTEAFLGIRSDSTTSAAIEDSESSDPSKRIMAAVVFSFLGTQEAEHDLKTLSSDADPRVAAIAKEAASFGQDPPAGARTLRRGNTYINLTEPPPPKP